MVTVKCETKGLETLQRELAAAPDQMRGAVRKGMMSVLEAVRYEIALIAPQGVSGNLARDWTIRMGDASGVLGSNVGYGLYVHEGTRPHWPPLEPLLDWVRLKLHGGIEMARALQRKIAAVGTKPQAFIPRAVDNVKPQIPNIMLAEVRAYLQRIADNVNKGA